MGLLNILLVILVLFAIGLTAYLIFTLRKVNINLDILRKNLEELNNKINPVLNNINNITEKLEQIISEVEEQVLKAKNFTASVKEGVRNLKISKKLDPENRIQRLIKNLSAFSKGISKFFNELKN